MALQGWFLVQNHEGVRDQQHHARVLRDVKGSEYHGFSKNGHRHTDIHRVADVAMECGRHQKFRGRNRGWSTQPANREFPSATEVDGGPDQEHDAPDPRRDTARRPREPAQQPPGHQDRDRARHEDREQERIQNGPESSRHGIVGLASGKTAGTTLL